MDAINKTPKISRILWISTTFIVVMAFILSLSGLSEYFKVAIAGEPRNYFNPWLSDDNLPWYYQDSYTYSSYSLISGLLFFIAATLTLCAKIQKKKTLAIIGLITILLLVFGSLISTGIQQVIL